LLTVVFVGAGSNDRYSYALAVVAVPSKPGVAPAGIASGCFSFLSAYVIGYNEYRIT